jgi:hypothetical protein
MAQARSFRDYIAHRFYNELLNAVAGYLTEGAASLRVSSLAGGVQRAVSEPGH